ncbi:hypothetical protein GCM10010082_29120 [Kushneria pakistanensis]|uniref:DUF1468 domain-containing protein n=1 Tax=Kushneria pakistanensis TaxID=1508770 RepID=A0ABQ3FPZ6_9GAMM|nr:tripartite tricarboxylate transporter TctB family protein [Kushneria pakistanensis]GHC32772.1 hypothetical protein GCM10010082_29120 [Kushneria pakistanensis]
MAQDIGKPVFDLILLVASATGFVMASQLPDVVVLGDLSPAFFPQLISALVFICAVPCLIRDTRQWLAARHTSASTTAPLSTDTSASPSAPQKASSAPQEAPATPSRGRRNTLQWLFVVAVSLAYIVMFEPLGYVISTTLFCLACVIGLWCIGGSHKGMTGAAMLKNIAGYAVYALVLAMAIYIVFTRVFQIPLPN